MYNRVVRWYLLLLVLDVFLLHGKFGITHEIVVNDKELKTAIVKDTESGIMPFIKVQMGKAKKVFVQHYRKILLTLGVLFVIRSFIIREREQNIQERIIVGEESYANALRLARIAAEKSRSPKSPGEGAGYVSSSSDESGSDSE